MMGGLCFMVDNTMCCTVSGRGGMLIRVGPAAHARMLEEPHTSPMEMRGRIMSGFIRVAPEGYQAEADLKRWVKRGLDFVAAMPKATGSKKAAPRKVAAKTKTTAKTAIKTKPKTKTAPRGQARKGPRR
jgi:hypothetical protein